MTDAQSPETLEVGPRRIDLDAARKARAEARGVVGGPVVVLEGEEFELPAELPMGALASFGALFAVAANGDEDSDRVHLEALGSLEETASSLFGGAWGRLKEKGLSFPDLEVLLEGALAAYGINLPE